MTDPTTARITTWLYVPADSGDQPDKALRSGADAVIVDLEDGVAPGRKEAARAALSSWLERLAARSGELPPIWVRINADSIAADLAIAAHAAVAGICLPKVDSAATVRAIETELSKAERKRAGDPMALMLMIETARGVLDCAQIATATDRVSVLQLGEQDLRADLGLPPALGPGQLSGPLSGPLPGPIRAAREAVVLASAAARLVAPVAPVSTTLHDADALSAETAALRRDGFGSRAVIHPAQLAPVVAGFAPTAAEVDWAERVVAADAVARESGSGVTVVDGRMVDAPVVAQARAIRQRSS